MKRLRKERTRGNVSQTPVARDSHRPGRRRHAQDQPAEAPVLALSTARLVQRLALGAGLLVGGSLLVGCSLLFKPVDLTMHGVVRELTYGNDAAPPESDHELYLYSILKPRLVRKYQDCPTATKAIRTVDWNELVSLGDELSKKSDAKTWVEALQAKQGTLLESGDPMVALAVGEAASQAATYSRELRVDGHHGRTTAGKSRRDALEKAGQSVLRRILDRACDGVPGVDGPSLALSGGAANGAFIAGFLFELLFLREQVYRYSEHDPNLAPHRDAFLQASRFSAVSGTSVGSMIGQLLDLYATSNLQNEDPEKKQAIEQGYRADLAALDHLEYERGFPPPTLDKFRAFLTKKPQDDGELARLWALALLFENFTDIAEPETICVQPGPASRLLGYPGRAHPGLMRFDPLQRSVIDPFLDKVGQATVDNDFPRVAVAVEVSQNVTVGLDDAACKGKLDRTSYCLAAGTMASTVLPFFAQPVNRVYTGLSQSEDCGIWLDGGLRSGLPIEQAMRFTRPADPGDGDQQRLRTLALSTDRAVGLPSSKSADGLLDIAGEAIGEMGDQIKVGEIESMSNFVVIQQDRWAELVRAMTPPPPFASPAAGASAPDGADGESPKKGASSKATAQQSFELPPEAQPFLQVVFVPSTVPDYFVAGAGYRFDPIVLRGLFVSGQKEALERALEGDGDGTGLLDRLGWRDLERGSEAGVPVGPAVVQQLWEVIAERLEADRTSLDDWLALVDCSWTRLRKKRHEEGKRRFDALVESCPEAPTAAYPPAESSDDEGVGAPAYFGGAPPGCRCGGGG